MKIIAFLSTILLTSSSLFPGAKRQLYQNHARDISLQIIQDHNPQGKTIARRDRVELHYVAWLAKDGVQGKQFDSTYDRGIPLRTRVGVGALIEGLDRALLQMHVGQSALVYIPSELAFGAYGYTDIVPPHADLMFKIEVVALVARNTNEHDTVPFDTGKPR